MALVTFYWSLDLVIFIIALFIMAYLYMTRKFLYWKERGVMQITPIPFIGNFYDVLCGKLSPGEWAKNLYDQSANLPYMGFYIFNKPFLLLRDPYLIKSVLLRDFSNFTDRYSYDPDKLSGAQLFFLRNPAWKLLRAKLTPTFTSGKLKKMFRLMTGVGDNLMTYLDSLNLEDGRAMDVKALITIYTTDTIAVTAFGLNANCFKNPNSEFRKQISQVFFYNFWRGVEWMSLFFMPQIAKVMGFRFFSKKFGNFMRQVFWETAAEREQSEHRLDDFVDRLIDLKKSEAVSPNKDIFEFDGDNLVAQACAFFAAGYETVSNTISFALYELALSPDVQTKLRQEIMDAIENNNGELTYDLVMGLPYLDMVLSEALRKYPSLAFLERVAIADYKVPNSNLVLEKGTPVYIPMLGLHYDPQYFPDPEVFDPQRFTAENKETRESQVYLPFGDGPRNCIGMRFALLETKLALTHIVLDYELSPCEKTVVPLKFTPAFLTSAEGGVHLKMRKIKTKKD